MEQTNNKDAPTFKDNDVVVLKEEAIGYATSHSFIIGKSLNVDKCYFTDLGDMEAEVVYLSTEVVEDKDLIQNPYLAKYFKLKE